jgi:hypothetical protein
MSSFEFNLDILVESLDPNRHAHEIRTLQGCRRVDDLANLASHGWLTPGGKDPRIKLVRHGSGTYLLVEYVDGWSKTVSQAPFQSR